MVDSTNFRDLGLRDATTTDALTSALGGGATEVKKKNDALGKNEFLNLLVTQLKNQDPMEPMKNDQFAVNLAQFSQLEQLIGINEKVGKASADLSSLAAYLGHEVTLDSDIAQVRNHDGGNVKIDLANDSSAVKIELLDPVTGSVKESFDIGALESGKHTLSLQNIASTNGEYQVKVTAISGIGGQVNVPVRTAAVVNGFIPGPTPKLLTNNGEIDPTKVVEVNLPPQA